MIVITAQTYNGQPVSGPSTSFDELGGTIGRAETNQLVLPDPERSVSRVHARLELRLGQWVLIDQGSNPVLLNGRPLGHGHEAPIADGDTLTIGGYELRVASAQRATRSDPFADLFGDAAATAPAAPATPAPSPRAAAPAWPSPTERTAMPGPAAPSTSSHAALIPEDWDPFAAPAPAAAAAGGPEPPPQAPPAAADSLDALFGLGPPGGDPLAQSPLAAPPAQPNTSRHADALRSLGSGPAPVAPPASETVFLAGSILLARSRAWMTPWLLRSLS